MVKVPGTAPGLPAIRTLHRRGHQRQRHPALFAGGLRAGRRCLSRRPRGPRRRGRRSAQGGQRRQLLRQPHRHGGRQARSRSGSPDATTTPSCAALEGLRGKVAIANAKLAYQRYKRLFAGPRWERLAAEGAQPQRLLWASTGTKNPAYQRRALRRGADRRRHGQHDAAGDDGRVPRPRPARAPAWRRIVAEAPACHGNARRGSASRSTRSPPGWSRTACGCSPTLPTSSRRGREQARRPCSAAGSTGRATSCRCDARDGGQGGARGLARGRARCGGCGQRDAALWTGEDEANWLGWLDIVGRAAARRLDQLRARFAEEVRAGAASPTSLLLGMGGSSLGPEVLAQTFGRSRAFPELHVLDSTDPAQIEAFEEQDRPRAHAVHRVEQVRQHARTQYLQAVFLRARAQALGREAGRASISSRSPIRARSCSRSPSATASAGSIFGVPEHRRPLLGAVGFRHGAGGRDAASTSRALPGARRAEMVRSCAASVPPADNPGVAARRHPRALAAKHGRDKVTIVASPGIAGLGRLARAAASPRSTGKQGKGLIPVDGEPLGAAGRLRRRSGVRLSASRRGRRSGAGRRRSRRWSEPASRSCGSRSPTATSSARNSSAGRWRPPWPARSSASIRSISPTSRRARSRPASSPTAYERTGALPARDADLRGAAAQAVRRSEPTPRALSTAGDRTRSRAT